MSLADKLAHTEALLKEIAAKHGKVALANSFGAEDMVLTHLIATLQLPIGIFSLDTGRLPVETYTLMQQVGECYPANPVRVFYPDATALEAYVNQNGINAFYNSVDLRKGCCHIRKIEPLKRALSSLEGWLTGLRRQQSLTRVDLPEAEFDADNGLMKYNPLLDWTEKDVWEYIRANDVPYNSLHDKHVPSIGCAPCTRPIAVGEDIRAGRWWWENPESKECGLHVKASPLKRPE